MFRELVRKNKEISKEECIENEIMSKADVAGNIVDFILTKMVMPV